MPDFDDRFHPRTLIAAIMAIEEKPRTDILDRVFSSNRGVKSSLMEVEMKAGSLGILPAISVYAPATVEDRPDRKIITFKAPRIAPKRQIGAADLLVMREMGGEGLEQLDAEIRDNLTDMKAEILRTREHYAAGSLTGKIFDSDGQTVLIDWSPPAENTIVLSGTDKWSDANSNPIADIRAWKKQISRAVAPQTITRYELFVSSVVMDALIDHPKTGEKLNWLRGKEIAEEGRIVRLAGVDITEYDAAYVDKAGNWVQYIPEGHLVLVGVIANGFREYFAPVPVMNKGGGKVPGGPGTLGRPFVVDSWFEKDPDGIWIRVQSSPVPATHYPGAVIKAQVVDEPTG